MNSLDWDDLRYFLAVADHGSLSAAAKYLGSNQPTIGRHIDALEVALGMRLFRRTPLGLHLTREGTRLLDQVRRIGVGVAGIERLAAGQAHEPAGTVRLAVPEGICSELVVPDLNRFHDRHPRIRLILSVSSRTANLTRGEADVAVRLFRPREADLKVRQLGTLPVGLFAGADYLERYGHPADETELVLHDVIAYGDELAGQPENRWLLDRADPERIILRSDSTTVRQQAAVNGLGLSIQPKPFALRSGLVPVLPGLTLPGYEVWMVYHRDLHDIFRVRVVLDFVASLFEKQGQRGAC